MTSQSNNACDDDGSSHSNQQQTSSSILSPSSMDNDNKHKRKKEETGSIVSSPIEDSSKRTKLLQNSVDNNLPLKKDQLDKLRSELKEELRLLKQCYDSQLKLPESEKGNNIEPLKILKIQSSSESTNQTSVDNRTTIRSNEPVAIYSSSTKSEAIVSLDKKKKNRRSRSTNKQRRKLRNISIMKKFDLLKWIDLELDVVSVAAPKQHHKLKLVIMSSEKNMNETTLDDVGFEFEVCNSNPYVKFTIKHSLVLDIIAFNDNGVHPEIIIPNKSKTT